MAFIAEGCLLLTPFLVASLPPAPLSFVHFLSLTCFPPFIIAPLVVSAICHFKESRIHAKMARHANDFNTHKNRSREKGMFSKLVSDLKRERQGLRSFSARAMTGFLALYAGFLLWAVLIMAHDDSISKMFNKPEEMNTNTTNFQTCTDAIDGTSDKGDPRHFFTYFGMILFLGEGGGGRSDLQGDYKALDCRRDKDGERC